jgi:hypothetical protein
MTASMASNSAKMNWTLSELGWELHRAGKIEEWDGLLGWFLEYMATRSDLALTGRMRDWHRAAKSVLAERRS